MCGLIAQVEDDKLISVRSNPDHLHSQGFMCIKSQAMIDVTYDEDRVLRPLKRIGGPGEFVEVNWDEAMGDIAHRLKDIRSQHGAASLATFYGNPAAFSFATMTALAGLQDALKVKWRYSINSEDAASRTVANYLLYGSAVKQHLPDIWHSGFALIIGANPYVSRGSLVSEPRFREALDDIIGRGGKVIIVDPRRTQTARRYEHVGIKAGTDTWFLLALLHVLIKEDLVNHDYLAEFTYGFDTLKALVAPYTPAIAYRECGIEAEKIEAVARDFAAAPRALVYGRHGVCTQQFGTLNNLLIDTLVIATGNFGREGGIVPPWGIIDLHRFVEAGGMGTYGAVRSRTTGQPDVIGVLPSTSLSSDISVPGPERVRALIGVACNPVLTSGGGGAPLEAALEQLDLHVSLDLYVNETNKHAHYVLPVHGFYERDDIPTLGLGLMLRPSFWATEAVISPRGDSRSEWWILDEIVRRQGFGGAYPAAVLRTLAKVGIRPTARQLFDFLLRTSSVGDWFGLRRNGLSFNKLVKRYPNGYRARDSVPITSPRDSLTTKDRKIHFDFPEYGAEIARFSQCFSDAAFPLRMIGMREVRSHNSWMHNVEKLMPDSRKHAALIHPIDAAAASLKNGDRAVLTSRAGSIEVAMQLSDDMTPGNIAVPYAWGHSGGWKRANRAGGAWSNQLASSEPGHLEALAGMTVLSGIPISIKAVQPQ
jgi:formate dehydrogenase